MCLQAIINRNYNIIFLSINYNLFLVLYLFKLNVCNNHHKNILIDMK